MPHPLEKVEGPKYKVEIELNTGKSLSAKLTKMADDDELVDLLCKYSSDRNVLAFNVFAEI